MTMSNGHKVREQRILDIEKALNMPDLPVSERQLLEKQRHDILEENSIAGTLNVSDDGRINGVAVGINLGRIIYGRDPEEEERQRLTWYLSGLAAKLHSLQLRGLDEQLEQGKGISLPQVYVMQAIVGKQTFAEGGHSNPLHFFQNDDVRNDVKEEYNPDWALPSKAIVAVSVVKEEDDGARAIGWSPKNRFSLGDELLSFPIDSINLSRAQLATEAVLKNQYLILLGDPGSGKSTFLRYLTWALAQLGLDQPKIASALYGWDDKRFMLPLILPLRKLAGRLSHYGINDKTIFAALRDEMEDYGVRKADDMLIESLHCGQILLLLDGLDEVPLDAAPDVADRLTTIRAVQNFIQLYRKISVVLTCRTRAFDVSLRGFWHVETMAPFTLGQIRHFIPAWYSELVISGQITKDQAKQLEYKLIEAILVNEKLRDMARTPLLLTMMTLILYNKNELPRDRPQLYERILELLLGQWDKVREGQSLSEAIGHADWGSERIRPVLDQLSYQAHAEATSSDGRGQLPRSMVREALITFFETAHLPNPWETARRCLDYFEQRSGLLMTDENDSYVFAHLTLQEHCAGRYIALNRGAATLIMKHRADDRWREPIFLGLGVIQQTKPELIDSILSNLIDQDENGLKKSTDRWQRDLILAAEIGKDRDWDYLRTQQVSVDRLQRNLKDGLVQLLWDKRQLLPASERVRASFLLGDLGDPRFPVTIEDWRNSIDRALKGDTSGYFCRIEPGTYVIASDFDASSAFEEEEPQHMITLNAPFLIARYLITNAQWQEWVKVGGRAPTNKYDTDFNHPNQPVTAVSWGQCNDYCNWLSQQIGQTVRLPYEHEWEAAARDGTAWRYPWDDARQDDRMTMAPFGMFRSPVPVGCYPAGCAPCGALDMIGNVWQWMADKLTKYPNTVESLREVDEPKSEHSHVIGDFIVRGGSFNQKEVDCEMRDIEIDGVLRKPIGLRVVIPDPAK